MKNTICLITLLLVSSTAAVGCFVSRKETVRTVPASSTTIEKRTSVETVPPASDDEVVRTRTTVERTYHYN